MKKKNNIEKYFRRYLQISPLGLALWRSLEAKYLSEITLKRPILDIGCGFGEFAVAFADEPIEMGVDICAKDLYAASKTKKYKNLTLADARSLPFSDNSYGSIFSISTLEHIDNPDNALKEAFRILRPGGILFLTLETDEVDSATFYRPFFQKIGSTAISSLATKVYNSLFHRETLLPKNEWIKKVKKAGFEIDKFKDIISIKVTFLFDLLLITAWPSQLFRLLIGKRIVFRPKFIENILVKRFLKYINKEEKNGTNLLIIAHKPE